MLLSAAPKKLAKKNRAAGEKWELYESHYIDDHLLIWSGRQPRCGARVQFITSSHGEEIRNLWFEK